MLFSFLFSPINLCISTIYTGFPTSTIYKKKFNFLNFSSCTQVSNVIILVIIFFRPEVSNVFCSKAT